VLSRQEKLKPRLILKLLIARGADPNNPNNLGWTAGAQLDSRDRNGKIPLDHARDMLKNQEDSWWADELKKIVHLLEENRFK
jgi:hypothetical protein